MGFFDGLFGKKKPAANDPKERRRNASVRLQKRLGSIPGARPSGENAPVSDEDTAEEITPAAENTPSGIEIDLKGLDALPGGAAAMPKTTVAPKPGQSGKPADSTSIIKGDAAQSDSSGTFAAPPQRATVTLSGRQRRRTSIAKKQLGNLLLSAQVIGEKHLEQALKIQETKGGLLGQILVDLKVCEKSQIGAALNKQRTITSIALEEVVFDPEALTVVTREFCEKHRLIPFEKIGTILCIAMANVLDSSSGNELRDVTQLKVKKFDATWGEISAAIEKNYAKGAKPAGPAVVTPVASAADETIITAATKPEQLADADSVIDLDDADLDNIIIELPEEKPAPRKERDTAAIAKPAKPAPSSDDDLEELDELEEMGDIEELDEETSSDVAVAVTPLSPQFFKTVVRDGVVISDIRWRAECVENAGAPALPSIRTA